MHKRILRPLLYRLGPFGVAALLFALVGAPSALAGTNTIQNPGFETGTFAYWGGGGSFGAYAAITPYNAHSGSYSAVIGYPYRPANIDTVINQYVYVPVFQPTLTFWIRPQCAHVDDDGLRVQVRDLVIPGFFQELINECTTSTSWIQRTVNMSAFAGRYVELRFEVLTRGRGSMATYTLLDDVSLT